MKAEGEIEKGISDIVGVFTDPIIAYPSPWMDTIPEWVKEKITLERLIMNMKALKGEEMTGTDAEALAYIYPASLEFPLDHDWAQIYLYLSTKVCGFWGKEVPKDIRVESLDTGQMRDLNRLKAWIYQKRITARQDRDRTARREAREEKTTKQKELQPSFFGLLKED